MSPDFDNLYGNRLYDDMAKTLKVPRGELRFTNAYKWLDEYVCANTEGKTPKRSWHHPETTEDYIRRYYRDLLLQGWLGRSDVSQVLASGLINELITSLN